MSKPVYTEEQARHWLWFLARNMQSHGQSMFMMEQLQPGWLLTKWQVFFYMLLSRTIMFGAPIMLVGLGITLFMDGKLLANVGYGILVFGTCIVAISLITGLFGAAYLFIRDSKSVPQWVQKSVRLLALIVEVVFLWGIVRPAEWMLQRNGRSLNDDIQPVERISWSWKSFLKGLAFLTIEPPRWDSRRLLNRGFAIGFWIIRIGWIGLLAALEYEAIIGYFDSDAAQKGDIAIAVMFLVPNLFCAFFSAIRGTAVELKTSPNRGILLSGRNGAITLSVTLILIFAERLLASRFQSGGLQYATVLVFFLITSIAGAIAWGRLGALDFMAHYCLRGVLWGRGYIPREYVRFLNYAATELGFLQKVGGGYVFMHRYLLEYFASSEQVSPGTADSPNEVQTASNGSPAL